MEEIVIPDFDDDDEFSLPSFSRSAFGQGAGSPDSAEHSFHRHEPSTSSDHSSTARPSFGSLPRSTLPKSSLASSSSQHDIAALDTPRIGKFSNSSASSLGQLPQPPGIEQPPQRPGLLGTRKGSFASLKNILKPGDRAGPTSVPPVPTFDAKSYGAPGYPTLKNPFSRFDVDQSPPSATSSVGRPRANTKASIASVAPPTLYNDRNKSIPAMHASQRSYGGRSTTSQSSSNFRADDYPLPALPPFANRSTPSRTGRQGSDASMFGSFGRKANLSGEDVIDSFGKTPAEEALRAVFTAFREAADLKVRKILGKPLNSQVSLPATLDSGVDPAFDELLSELGICARRHARRVIDLLTAWCRQQSDYMSTSDVRAHLSQSLGLQIRSEDAASVLASRKASAARFILYRALITIVRIVPSDSLGEDVALNLEHSAFSLFRSERTEDHVHRRAVSALLVEFLSEMSKTRFLTVSDRFTRELSGLSGGQSKDNDAKIEHILKGARQLKLEVYPEEELEMAAEFVETMASFFSAAHGNVLKCAYAETLTHLLHPVIQTATAEVNHPVWARSIGIILQRAMSMASKPRYWSVAFPLVVVALAVSPREIFLEHWQTCIEYITTKCKDRSMRIIGMNAMVRLLWVYLNRCPESSTSTRKKLEVIIRHCFPASTGQLLPADLPLEPFVAMLHYVMMRQIDYGQELASEFLKDCVPSRSPDGSSGEILHPERAYVAMKATTFTLRSFASGKPAALPTSGDFTRFDFAAEEPAAQTQTEPAPETTDFIDKCGPMAIKVLLSCDTAVGGVLLSSDAVTLTVHASSASWENSGDQVTRKHGDIYVAYSTRLESQFRLFAALLEPLLAMLPTAKNPTALINILCRATFSANPSVCEIAVKTLQLVAEDPELCPVVVDNYRQFVFDTQHVFRDHFVGTRLLESQLIRVITLWINTLKLLAAQHRANETPEPVEAAFVNKVEACGLFLLCSSSANLRRLAHPVFNAARDLIGQARGPSAPFRYSRLVPEPPTTASVVELYEKDLDSADITALRKIATMSSADRNRLDAIHGPKLVRKVAESDSVKDAALWAAILPVFVGKVNDQFPAAVHDLRSLVGQTVVRLQAHVSMVASSKATRQSPNRATSDATLLAEQWRLYLSILCVTLDPNKTAQVSRKDATLSSEVMMTPALLGYLIQILAWEDRRFQDAAAYALGAIRQPALRILAENLLSFVRRLADTYKTSTTPGVSRRPSSHGAMWTAAAHVFRLIVPLISDSSRGANATNHLAILSSFIGFVKLTLTLLSDRRDDYDLQSLRRWFCIVVDHLATALGKLDSSDRFLGEEVRGAIFKLCYDWCHVGRRPDVAKARESQTLQAAADSYRGDRDRAQYLDELQTKTKQLSAAAAEAMASLCLGRLISADDATPAQQVSDHIVDPLTVLRWIRGMFQSSLVSHHETARKALHALVKYNWGVPRLSDEVLHQSFGEGEHFALNASFFGVVADIISDGTIALPPAQLACLSLSKLGHPVADVRQRAFQLAVWLFEDPLTQLSLASLLPAVGSSAPNVYLLAQQEMATRLASLYPDLALSFLSECTTRLTQLDAPRRRATLRILPAFMKVLVLEADTSKYGVDETVAEHEGLSNLMYLVVRFSDDHLEEVQDILVNFAGSGRSRNTTALVKFLFEQGAKRGNPEFVQHAQQIMACLATSPAGDVVFDEICGFVDPSDMATSAQADVPASPVASLANLDTLFTSSLRTKPLSQGQMALLFAGELLPHQLSHKSLPSTLPTLLHVAFIHCDDANLAMREQAQKVLFQVLRAWVSRLSNAVALEPAERAAAWSAAELKTTSLAQQRDDLFWEPDDAGSTETFSHAPAKMSSLVAKILGILGQIQPKLRQQWGSLALDWATSCTIRHLACRSFQVFRILSPDTSGRMVSDMLARLSSTIASSSTEVQAFNTEVLRTFASIVQSLSPDDMRNYPQIFWCALVCLTDPYEAEFNEVVDVLSHILDKTNLADPTVVKHLLSFRPPDLVGPPPLLQSLLLIGLRSAKTDMMTFDVLRRLTSVPNSLLIDEPNSRLLHGFVAALPWMLHATDLGETNEELEGMASDLADIAERQGDAGLSRLLTSFARKRFRSKDDFIRQAASLLREHLADHALELTTLLLGFVLNRNDWMRDKSLQMLKMVISFPEAQAILAPHSRELAQPLLRLVSTKHAAQAFEVLELPTFSTDPSADSTPLFGPFEPSGWSVPAANERAGVTRSNVLAVFNTCAVESRAASAHFSILQFSDLRGAGESAKWGASQNSLDLPSPPMSVPDNASMGDLVGALHSLNQFFDDGLDMSPMNGTSPLQPRRAHYGRKSSDSVAGDNRIRAVIARGHAATDEEYTPTGSFSITSSPETGAGTGSVNSHRRADIFFPPTFPKPHLINHQPQPSVSSESEFGAAASDNVFALDDRTAEDEFLTRPVRPWQDDRSRTPSPRDGGVV